MKKLSARAIAALTNGVLALILIVVGAVCFFPTSSHVAGVEERVLYRGNADDAVSLMFNVYWGSEEVEGILADTTYYVYWQDNTVRVRLYSDLELEGAQKDEEGYIRTIDDIEVKDNYLENWIEGEETEKVKNILRINGLNPENNIKKVIVHATSGNRKKEWSKENWARIIEYLSNEKNVQVLFNGTKNDSETYKQIMSLIKEDLKIEPINLCGCFSLRETLAFTSLCDLLVGVDSGNLHIAASVGVPVIGIYGPMNTIKWQAHEKDAVVIKTNLPCQPCGLKKKCKRNYQCIKDISVNILKTAIDERL